MNWREYLYRRLADDAAVAALIGLGGSPAEAKVFPIQAPQRGNKGAPPYVIYQQVGGAPDQDLAGPGAAEARVQLTCRAATLDAANQLGDAVRAALDGLDEVVTGWGRITALCILELEQYDDAPKTYAKILDFSVFHPG